MSHSVSLGCIIWMVRYKSKSKYCDMIYDLWYEILRYDHLTCLPSQHMALLPMAAASKEPSKYKIAYLWFFRISIFDITTFDMSQICFKPSLPGADVNEQTTSWYQAHFPFTINLCLYWSKSQENRKAVILSFSIISRWPLFSSPKSGLNKNQHDIC